MKILKKKKKRSKKKNKEPEYDEEGNIIEKKGSKKKKVIIIFIVLLIIAIIGGAAAFFIINLNKPENVVLDFATYFSNGQWEQLADSVDMRGFYTLLVTEDAEYTKFDEKYKTIEDEENYSNFVEFLDGVEDNRVEILKKFFKDYTLSIDEIRSVEKIENTESLNKIQVVLTMTMGEEKRTDVYDVYVAKINDKYKIVGGQFALMVEVAYEYSQYQETE